jgi:hypothetical protein
MASKSEHISISIDRAADEVYSYASNPLNLPHWAAGLGTSVEQVEGRWMADSPMGRVIVDFAEPNDYGVLDHHVTLPSGERVHNPMRVISDGPSCEVVFTVRQRPGTSDEDFASDAAAVSADLATLKRVLESD